MFRCFRILLADAAAKPAAGGAGGAKGKATPKKRSKWIDRRSHKIRHDGKQPYPVWEQPACALCNVRFRWVEDYQAHKQSSLHINREKWAEQEKWWSAVGEQAHFKARVEDDERFHDFLEQRAVASGLSQTALEQSMRRAQVNIGPKHCTGVDVPSVRGEIVEPRDQRWPSSPKW